MPCLITIVLCCVAILLQVGGQPRPQDEEHFLRELARIVDLVPPGRHDFDIQFELLFAPSRIVRMAT